MRYKKPMLKKMAEDAKSNPKEDSGDVPFTLGAK